MKLNIANWTMNNYFLKLENTLHNEVLSKFDSNKIEYQLSKDILKIHKNLYFHGILCIAERSVNGETATRSYSSFNYCRNGLH